MSRTALDNRTGYALTWLRRALLLALTALAAWLLVRLLLALFVPSSTFQPVLIAGAAPANAPGAGSYDFSYDPFTEDEPVVTVIEEDPGDDAPETTLNLTLKGLRAGANGSAYIRTPDGQEDNFYTGEQIMPGVVLRGVFPDYVLLDVNGQTQRLTTEDAKAARAGAARPGTAPRSDRLSVLGAPDASNLLSQVRAVPSFDANGNRVGISLQSLNSSLDLSTYGLRPGDVITDFGGVSLTSGLPDIAALRRAYVPGRPISVTLIRDGQRQTITIGNTP